MAESDRNNQHSSRDESSSLIVSGNKALENGNWSEARNCFEQALHTEDHAEAHFGLARALWWQGDIRGTLDNYTRAYTAFRDNQNPTRAADTAMAIALEAIAYLGNESVGSGWLARSRRLIKDHKLYPLEGDLQVLESCFASDDPDSAEKMAREALETARKNENADLELRALSSIGVALVNKGRVEDGMNMLEEAMAGSLGGEPADPCTVVFTCCDMMVSSSKCAAFERSLNCIRAAEQFEHRYGCPFLHIECRVIYGNILLATGKWSEAENVFKQAISLTKDSIPSYHVMALAGLAELRLKQAKMEEAERLIDGLHDHPEVLPVLAELYLNQKHYGMAISALQRRLELIGETHIESARLLELYGEADIAQGDHEAAFERGRKLADLGRSRKCRLMVARGERLKGLGMSSADDPSGARRFFDQALPEFAKLHLPFETARTHYMIAEALQHNEPETAISEARSALSTFNQLGAAAFADASAGLLRELGVPASRSPTRGRERLTKREQEVAALVGEGLSNPEIAQRLFISRKTVEHHVSRIIAKLNLKNRTELAAESVRRKGKFE